MELSTGQQRLLFAAVVLVLAGLGIYLLGPGAHRGAGAAPTPSASSPSAAAANSPPATLPSTSAPAVTPATSPSATVSGGPADIYQWLPFTQQDLTEAAQTTVAFAADYETFTYTENATAYAAKMSNLVTSELAGQLESAYATTGVAAQRSAQKQVSTSSGGIASIRAFGSGSITFLVNIAQRLATTKGKSTSTNQYAVTVVAVTGGGWEVDDIEPANAGNQ
jgi:hypothetical protein